MESKLRSPKRFRSISLEISDAGFHPSIVIWMNTDQVGILPKGCIQIEYSFLLRIIKQSEGRYGTWNQAEYHAAAS